MAYYAVAILTCSLFVTTVSAAPKDAKDSILVPNQNIGGYDEYAKKINSLLSSNLIQTSTVDKTITSESDDDDNCPTITTTYMVNPISSNTTDVIVQTELFSQSLIVVTCKNKVHPESHFEDGEPQCFRKLGLHYFGLRPICEEVIGTRSLMVYDPETHEIRMKSYDVSVGCACNIYNTV